MDYSALAARHLESLSQERDVRGRQTYIEERLSELAEENPGLTVRRENLSLPLRRDLPPLGKYREYNIVAETPSESHRTYIAHYDAVGVKGAGRGGVVDNASGVALTLSFLERELKSPSEYGVRAIFSVGEEGAQRTTFGLLSDGLVMNFLAVGLPFGYLANLGLVGVAMRSDYFRMGLRGSKHDANLAGKDPEYMKSLRDGGLLAVDCVGAGEIYVPITMGDASLSGLFFPVRTDAGLNKKILRAAEANGEKVCAGHFSIGSCDAASYPAEVPKAALLRIGKIPYHTSGDSISAITDPKILSKSFSILSSYHSGAPEKPPARSGPYEGVRLFESEGGTTTFLGYFKSATTGNGILEVRRTEARRTEISGNSLLLGETLDWTPATPDGWKSYFGNLGREETPRGTEIELEGIKYVRDPLKMRLGSVADALAQKSWLGVFGGAVVPLLAGTGAGIELARKMPSSEGLIGAACAGIFLGALGSAGVAKLALKYHSEWQGALMTAVEKSEIRGWARPIAGGR
jgi:hypothetical protein